MNGKFKSFLNIPWCYSFQNSNCNTWRYSRSLINPLRGDAQPSERTWTHWRSIWLISSDGSVSVSALALMGSAANSSSTDAWAVWGKMFYNGDSLNLIDLTIKYLKIKRFIYSSDEHVHQLLCAFTDGHFVGGQRHVRSLWRLVRRIDSSEIF